VRATNSCGGSTTTSEINGAALDPFAAYLLIRGLKILEPRVARHNENAMKVARYLERHPAVDRSSTRALSLTLSTSSPGDRCGVSVGCLASRS
jgi:O-acetylhomoserine/O-acetylserine sulfhydrylase-like pyridoxal-dependent enzyme